MGFIGDEISMLNFFFLGGCDFFYVVVFFLWLCFFLGRVFFGDEIFLTWLCFFWIGFDR